MDRQTDRKTTIICEMLKDGYTTSEIIKEFANNYGKSKSDRELIKAVAKNGGYPTTSKEVKKVYTIKYKFYEYDTPRTIRVQAKSESDALDEAVWKRIPNAFADFPSTAWVEKVEVVK